VKVNRKGIYLSILLFASCFCAILDRSVGPIYGLILLLIVSSVVYPLIPAVYRRDVIYIHQRAFAIMMLCMFITSVLFNISVGTVLGGNDEAKFYYWIIDALRDYRYDKEIDLPLSHLGYTVPLVYYYNIVDILGSGAGASPCVGKIWTVFWTSWIPVLLFSICENEGFSKKISYKVGLISAFMPLLLYYGSLHVRDNIVAFNYVFFFFLLTTKISNIYKYSFISLFVVYTYYLRPESGVFMMIAVILYHFMVNDSKVVVRNVNSKMIILIFVVFMSLLSGAAVIKILLPFDFHYLYSLYLDAMYQNADSTSIGFAIKTLPVPFNYIGTALVGMLGTFPPQPQLISPHLQNNSVDGLMLVRPYFNTDVDLGRILKAMTPISWYFILPFFLDAYIKKDGFLRHHPNLYAFGFILVVYISIVSSMTFELARLYSLGSIFYLIGLLSYYHMSKSQKKKCFLVGFMTFAVLSFLYVIVKFIL